MTPRRILLALIVLLSLPALLLADDGGQVTVGHARFTVVTPQLVRMEYAADGKFVDAPSWFAVRREARFMGAKISHDAAGAAIDTGSLRLTYHDDGHPFSPDNLSATIAIAPDRSAIWHPGDANPGNLGGTIRTLDGKAVPVPLGEGVLSRDGWFLLDDSKSDLFVGDWIQPRPSTGNLDWYLFGYGTDYRAALRSMTAVGGPVPLPRKYALGVWYSRYWPYSADEFKAIVQQYADHGFPLDTIVMDMDWHLNAVPPGTPKGVNTWTGYTWDRALIPDPPGLLKWFHDHGLHVTLNDHPAAGVQPHEEMYDSFMHATGHDPAGRTTVPFDAGSKPYLDAFYQFTHAPREHDGVDFWWLDWQQYPNTRSIPDLTNLAALNYYNFTRTSADGQRGQSFSRWAGWGDHRYPIEFSGDAYTGWSMLAFEVPFTATAGNVGAFFWSHDIGGHQGGRNEESYTRWCQFGALTAALRSHSTRNATMDRRPWGYPAWAEDSMRVSFGLRSRLMPYLYTSMWRATRDSVPFTRPMYIDHPTVEEAYHNGQEYQFGDDLLVAPIATPGVGPGRVASQAVWFPPGDDDWFDFFTGERFGPGEHAVATAGINEFPLYVRGGVPLPMQPYNPRPATAPLATLLVRCYPGRDGVTGSSEVYEDDGTTVGYEHGQSAITPLAYLRHGDTVTITIGPTRGTFPGRPDRRALVIELPCTQANATSSDGPCSYDAATFTTRLELPPAGVDVARTVTVQVKEMPADQVTAAAVAAHLHQLGDAASDHPEVAAAVRGVAVMPVNQHPYGLGGSKEHVALLYLHNHQTTPDTLAVRRGGAAPTTMPLASGDRVSPVSAAGPAHPLRVPGEPLTFSHLPEGLPDLHLTTPARLLPPQDDLARRATATASSGNAAAAIDGSTEGFPGNQSHEWVTHGQKVGAWIKLSWPKPTRVGCVYLYDRPNLNDQVVAGTLELSDGTRFDVGELPNDGVLPGVVAFPPRDCAWVKFTVTRTGDRSENIGLSELAVTAAGPTP
jgi:alpha-glucosidase (family GH31 glycosyl hydrolase)